ncbi:hypothetical protein Q5752_003123 [Cryptotrichosporon argae]
MIPTSTPTSLLSLPDKAALVSAFVGQPLGALRTPALVVDRGVFRANCARVTAEVQERGLAFRAHVKTHKTAEGTRMQLEAAAGVRAVICSTLPEVWGIIDAGLVRDKLVDDILYSMPPSEDKLDDLHLAQTRAAGATIRLMLDDPAQVSALSRASARLARRTPWSVFIKVDGGGRRAGNPPRSAQMRALVRAVLNTQRDGAAGGVEIFGFYSHFGQSYAATSAADAGDFFRQEVACVVEAADEARAMGAQGDWTLSVGATPTAHAAGLGASVGRDLGGAKLEVHAGCYCMCDLQQLATTLVSPSDVALTVLTTVVSLYPHRGEALCDAGALALSKDAGPEPGFGRVVSPGKDGWRIGRISQEHGTLVRAREEVDELSVGDRLRVIGQHACLICAAYPWFYVVDGGHEVVDVWVPWKGW